MKMKIGDQLVDIKNDILTEDLEASKKNRIQLIKETCKQVIEAGFTSTAKNNTLQHYSLKDYQQINMKATTDKIEKGASKVLWSNANQTICEIWTANEFMQLYEEAEFFIISTRLYSDALEEMVKIAQTSEEVFLIKWGIPLDSNLQLHINSLMNELTEV